MPKTPIDYSKGFIYRLVCKDLSVKEIYVGSSTNFRQRKRSHKCSCTKEGNEKYHLKVYQYMRDNGGWNNWDMIEIEKYPCNDEYELKKRERYWMEELKSSLNCTTPTKTQEEWREDNPNYDKDYYQNNKEKKNKQSRQNYYDNIEHYTELNRQRYEENKEERLEYGKEYREKHKEKIEKQKKEQIICECGGTWTKGHGFKRHEKTKKHQNYIQSTE